MSVSSTRLLRQFISTLSHQSHSTRLQSNLCRSFTSQHLAYSATHTSQRRTFVSSQVHRAAVATHPPGQPTQLIYHPDPSIVKNEDRDEPDIELIPLEEAKLEMTERAAEQLRTISERQKNPEAALRIAVESGGCHGYQYKMELAKQKQPDDYVFSHPTIKPSNIVVDAVSMSLLKGSVVDFATELIGSSFRVAENPQAKGSGCGCGVSWELKDIQDLKA
ncbi:FeS cluster biogenesis domain-containing protein [Abortiporus biennis]